MQTNNHDDENLHIRQIELEDVKPFTYLIGVVNEAGDSEEGVDTMVSRAHVSFLQLRRVWQLNVLF